MNIETLISIIAEKGSEARKGATETQQQLTAIYAGILDIPEKQQLEVLGAVLAGASPAVTMAFCKSIINRALWMLFTQEQARRRMIEKGQDPDQEYPGQESRPLIPTETVEELHGMLDLAYQAAFHAAFNWLPEPEPLPWGSKLVGEQWQNATCLSQGLLWIEEQAAEREAQKKAEAQKSRVAIADVFAKYRQQ